nr:GDSL esterase/lipase 4-like [Malus domestica]
MATTIAEVVWLQQLLQDLHVDISSPPSLHCDNVSAMALATNPGHLVAFGEQFEQFARVHDIISKLQGESGLANISKSLFLFSVGGNDIFEHFLFNNTTSAKVFIATLMSTYESRLRRLFDLGAKKFGIISVPPVGCVPLQRNSAKDGSCSEPMNEYAKLFYKALQGVLQK